MVNRGEDCVFYSVCTEIPVPLSFIGDIVDKSYLQYLGAGSSREQQGAGSGERGAGSIHHYIRRAPPNIFLLCAKNSLTYTKARRISIP